MFYPFYVARNKFTGGKRPTLFSTTFDNASLISEYNQVIPPSPIESASAPLVILWILFSNDSWPSVQMQATCPAQSFFSLSGHPHQLYEFQHRASDLN